MAVLDKEKQVLDIGALRASDGTKLITMWSVQVPPGSRPLQRHSHIAFEISLVEQGSGVYTAGGREKPMAPGDMFVFASNEVHCITDVGDGGLKLINLHIEPRCLWGKGIDSLSENNINLCFSHSPAFENRLPAGKNETLQKPFLEIFREFSQERPEFGLGVKSWLNMLLIALIRDGGYGASPSPVSRSRLQAIREVLKYIDGNLSGDLSLQVLGKVAGMSPNYLSAVFHKTSGIPLWDYIGAKRVDMAAELITQEMPQNILEIALRCGFNNTANFNKTFKKFTGVTPTQYRALNQLKI